MLSIGERRSLRRRVLRGLISQSQIFAYMLGVHTGTLSAREVPLGAFAGFVRAMFAGDAFEDGDVV